MVVPKHSARQPRLLPHWRQSKLKLIKCIRNRQLVSTYCIVQVYFSYQETDLVVVQAQNIRAHFSLVTENIIVITRVQCKTLTDRING